MDELTLLRSLAPAVTHAAAVERFGARARLDDHIARRLRRSGSVTVVRLLRSRGSRSVVLALAAILVVGSVSLVGGIHYFGEWGSVDHPATVAQIDAEIDAAIATTPLPPGYRYPVAAIRSATESDAVRAEFVGAHAVAWHAMCAWTDDWLAGYRAGDAARMAAALPTIEAFPGWLIADPRFAADSIRDELATVVAGARAGDAAPLQTLYEAAGCEALLAR